MRSIIENKVLLGDIAELRSGVGFPKIYQGKSKGDYPFAKVGDISEVVRSGGSFINNAPNWVCKEELSSIKAKPFPPGTIAFAKIGEAIRQNFRVLSSCSMLFDNNVMGIVPKPKIVCTQYLFHFFKTIDLYALAEKTTVPSIRKSTLEKISLPLPPLEEQKRIAAILDKADAIRRKRKEAIALTEELLRSTFLDMFGDPVTNPKGWKTALFGDVGILNRGKSKHRPRNDPSLLSGKYPLIQTGEVANCKGIIESYTQTYSEEGLAQSKMWDAGTLCITIAANIAKTGILGFDACFPDSIVGFQPNKKTTNEYIQGWLQFLQPVLEDRAPQSAQKNINLEILRKLDLPVPPIELQQKFSVFTHKVRDSAKKNESNELLLDKLFNSLLQKAFRGEL